MAGSLDSVRGSLYGPERTKLAESIKQTMLQGSVLTSGEYNFIPERERTSGLWQTSAKRDFVDPETINQADFKVEKKTGNLSSHVNLGGEQDKALYTTSLTKGDFDKKTVEKRQGFGQERTVNWPDMAPQFATDRNTGMSVYYNTYLNAALPPSTPSYPRIFTTNQRQAPGHDNTDVKFNRRVNLSLGSDPSQFEPESTSSYRPPAECMGQVKSSVTQTAAEISHNMRKLNKNSNVFRTGDYNNMRQEPGSIFNLDYSKKSVTPSTYKIEAQDGRLKLESRRGGRRADTASEDSQQAEDMYPQITRNYLQHDRQGVLDGASEGRDDQANAHFVFGSDGHNPRSIYAKDFGTESRNVDHPKMFCPAPPGSQVLQFDPAQSKVGSNTTTKNVHAGGTFIMGAQVNDVAQTQKNLAKRKGTSISLTTDGYESKDRMASLSHSSYVLPPSDFQSLRPRTTPRPAYNYLHTDVALPFKVNKAKSSEASTQYRGFSMDPENSRHRQMSGRDTNKAMVDWGKSTHFINGYAPSSYVSEQTDLFRGEKKSDQAIPAAGTTEKKPDAEFSHLSISENTQDYKSNPNRLDFVSTNTFQKRQHFGRTLPYQPVHKASVMANDYAPLHTRIYTPAQLMTMRKYDTMADKTIEKTHFFHTDNSGNKHLETTAMADFTSPEKMMTPRAVTSVQ